MIRKFYLFLIILPFISVSNLSFARDVEEVVVTGSYIKGSPTDGASPVELYDRDTIEGIGAVDAADITANMVIDSGSENNADSFTSGALQGRTNVNLRGLGLSSTLVLFDGRRQTVTGSTANDGSVFVNTSAIPVIALDRVEVLKEGAASVYGSDAVAGVVNYIFRRDFTGFEVDITSQETDLGSSKDNRGSFYEIFKLGNYGQLSISTTKPGVVRGNHFHHSKQEKFLVVSGECHFKFRSLNTGEVISLKTSDKTKEVVEVPLGYTHNFTNIGSNELVVLIWCNEEFDKDNPDTYFLEV